MAGGLDAWIRVVRVKFFLAGIPSVSLGIALSWHLAGIFDPLYFSLTLFGVIFAMAGCYTFNEYFDLRVDKAVREEDITPYSAGSRVLPKGLLRSLPVLRAGIGFWLLAFIIGVYLTITRGWPVIPLALAGFLAGAFYTAPPFKFAYRGAGEALIGLTYGPLITLGSCYVQLAGLPPLGQVILASLVPGFLITAVIWINEFPDFFADRKVGKKNLVARMGRKKAGRVYALLLTAPYISLVVGVSMRLFPPATLMALLTLPIAHKNIATVRRKYDKPRELIPAMSGTILLFALSTFLLAAGFLVPL